MLDFPNSFISKPKMSDTSFEFDHNSEFDTLEEGLASDEEDEDYDALNDETFGEDIISEDWEENHEKFAKLTELSRHTVEENGDFGSQMAPFFLDDEPMRNSHEIIENSLKECSLKENNFNENSIKPTPRPPPGFRISLDNNGHLDINSSLPSLKNVCTVEEIERNLIKPPVNSLRLEDLERNLIPKPSPPVLNLRSSSLYSNLPIHPPRQPPMVSGHPQKVPPYPQFQIQSRPHLIIPPSLYGMRSGLQPPPPGLHLFLRLPHPMGPGRRSRMFSLPRSQPEDEYAGLMTDKEKQWLASIQLMPLNTSTPFQDDYYYIMYQHRQSGHHGRKLGCPLKSSREQQTVTKSTYTPLQFENSLGKLQVGSVTAPRKIIDTDIVESIECTTYGSSSRKVKQTLLEVEHMFSDVLLAEEALSPLATHFTDDIDPNQLFSKTVQILLKNDKLKTVLNIRKGKALVLRVLSHPQVSSHLAHKIVTILPSVAKKDSDQGMLRALPAIRQFLTSCSIDKLVELSQYLKLDIPFLLSNKFGVSVIANMIERAEFQISQTNSESLAWIGFMEEILCLCPLVELVERPVVGISGPILSRHLSRCISANNQHIAILQKALQTLNSSIEKQ